VVIVASVTSSWLPPGALPSSDKPETRQSADEDADSDITVPMEASVTCSWLPNGVLPSIDMRQPREMSPG
jgi:hypothetical protein